MTTGNGTPATDATSPIKSIVFSDQLTPGRQRVQVRYQAPDGEIVAIIQAEFHNDGGAERLVELLPTLTEVVQNIKVPAVVGSA